MPHDRKLKVLVLPVADVTRASTRVRIHEMKPFLEQAGLDISILPVPKRGDILRSIHSLTRLVSHACKHDVLLVQKKLLKLPATWMLSRLSSTLVFDFDDALHVPHPSILNKPKELKRHKRQTIRFNYLLKRANLVISGNHHLAEYSARFNSRIEIVPSCIDIEKYVYYRRTKLTNHHRPVIFGWIGHGMNLVDFDHLHEILRTTFRQLRGKAVLRVVSSRPLEIKGIDTEFVPWSVDSQFKAMADFDVGLMPLANDERSLGRCGYKAIQYMGLGLPVVCSDVGDASRVVINGETGMVARSPEDWRQAILTLASSSELRERLGAAGGERVAREYSFQSCAPRVASILRGVVD